MTTRPQKLARIGSLKSITQWLVITGSLVYLLSSAWYYPPPPAWAWVWPVVILLVAIQVNYPIYLLNNQTYLVQVLTLGSGLLFGVTGAGWSAAAGMLLGFLFQRLSRRRTAYHPSGAPVTWVDMLRIAGRHIISLLSALYLSGYPEGLVYHPEGFSAGLRLATPLLLYALIHGLLFLIENRLRAPREAPPVLRRDLTLLAMVEVLPLPFVLITVLSYPSIGISTLIALGSVPVLIAVLLSAMNSARLNLDRRLQELATLDQVSQALRLTRDLDALLLDIHRQLSRLLEVDNFYVALCEENCQRIWYPLAMKQGQRQNWPSRPLAGGATDQVIRERRPILVNPRRSRKPAPLELSPGGISPTAWIGVPLITSDRVIGCLALYSINPGTYFSRADLDLLTILSGQISVAIENALLFQQAAQRTAQLETLNRLAALITASLQPQEVLRQVCASATEVGGGNHSAIFLIDTDQNIIWLAYAHQLSPDFIQANQAFSLTHNARTRCLRTGKPHLAPSTMESSLDRDWALSLRAEGIQALGDFPLVTPEGQIGFLSVYFDQTHEFDEAQVSLLQTFAAQAAIAVANARLYARTDTALSQRLNQLSILESVGRELAAAMNSERLFEMILTYAREFTNSPWGSIGLVNPESQQVEVKASSGYSDRLSAYPVDEGAGGRAVRTRQPVNLPDVRVEPGYVDRSGGNARSHLSIPLLHESRVLGVLSLESPQANAYLESDAGFINQLANQATVAVVNAALFADASHGRDRLAAILDSVREGMLMVAPNGRILLANESIQAITSVVPSSLIGQQLDELPEDVLGQFGYTGEDASRITAALARGQVDDDPKVTLKVIASKERVLERNTLPVTDSQGGLIGWMLVLRDVTEEHEIAQARELITETLVHDLRSPLSAVLGAIDVIEENAQQTGGAVPANPQALQVARRGARRVLSMVESLLDISRMQSGSMELNLAEVSLHDLARAIAGEYSTQAEEYGIRIVNEVQPNLPPLRADASKAGRVLMNLVDNALKFTPTGGEVRISADGPQGGWVTVRVSDTGPGIPAEYREKIFERFTQVPGQRGRRRGSGLGLTFCRLAVEAHGGRIRVEPGSPDGSVFLFTLPLAGEAKEDASPG